MIIVNKSHIATVHTALSHKNKQTNKQNFILQLGAS